MGINEHWLPAILDLKAAAPLHQMFLAKRGTDLQLNGAQVQRLGAQCLQVLLSAQAAWMADRKALTIIDPSIEFISSVELFGADQQALFSDQEQSV